MLRSETQQNTSGQLGTGMNVDEEVEDAARVGDEDGEEEEDPMEIETISIPSKVVVLLRRFLLIQQRRAEAYAKLRRGFNEYMAGGAEVAYQQLCGEITLEFNHCSRQVIEMESILLLPEYCRRDLANLMKDVQNCEKQKLHLTAQIQILKKAGRPSERAVSNEICQCNKQAESGHAHALGKFESIDVLDSEADADYDNALKEAIKGVQDAVTGINDHLEEVRYEIEALESG